MNKTSEDFSGKSIVVAGAVSLLLLAGCSSDKVLTERPYIPAPSDQIPPAGTTGLTEMPGTNLPPVPELPPFQEPKIEPLTYKVQKGDSLWKIARMHGVSMQELAAFNNMELKSVLKVGTILRIPPGGAPVPPEKLPPVKNTSSSKDGKTSVKSSAEALPSDGVYTVKNGDSLWKIAKKFNTSVDKLAAANNIDTKSPLQVGQKIRISAGSGPLEEQLTKPVKITQQKVPVEESVKLDIPVDENKEIGGLDEIINEEDMKSLNAEIPTPIKPSSRAGGPMLEELKGFNHDVQEGETWQIIANMYGVKVEDLKRANPSVTNPVPGTKIIIPDSY